MSATATDIVTDIRERVDALPWSELRRVARRPRPRDHAGRCSTPASASELAALFDGGRFRSTIDMARHRFGDGRYRYFDHPLPGHDRARCAASFYRAPRAGRQRLGAAAAAGTTRRSPPSTRSCSSAAARPARRARRR